MISQLKAIIESELNKRKVYEDALEVVRTVERLKTTEEETKATLTQVLADIERLRNEKTDAERHIENAKEQCDAMIGKAKQDADAIIQNGHERAQALVDAAEAKMVGLKSERKRLEKEVDDLQAMAKEKRVEHDEIAAALSEAKTKLRGLIG